MSGTAGIPTVHGGEDVKSCRRALPVVCVVCLTFLRSTKALLIIRTSSTLSGFGVSRPRGAEGGSVVRRGWAFSRARTAVSSADTVIDLMPGGARSSVV